MKVHGHEISEDTLSRVTAKCKEHRVFTFATVVDYFINIGGVPRENGKAERAADRLLQSLRKRGFIKFSAGVWTVVKP